MISIADSSTALLSSNITLKECYSITVSVNMHTENFKHP